MDRFVAMTLLAFAATAISRPASAMINIYKANITHDQVVGIPDEGSSGLGTFVLNTDVVPPTLSYDITLIGLDLDGLRTPGNADDNVTGAHLHVAPFGASGSIVFGLIDPSASLRNDLDDLLINAASGMIHGVWDGTEGNGGTLTDQLPSFLTLNAANQTNIYFNVHTTDHPSGEIRGQLTFVPEPATLAIFALSVLVAGGIVRRRN